MEVRSIGAGAGLVAGASPITLVLSLRVYHAVPDSVLAEVIRSRETLYRFYRRAYSERMNGIGAAIVIEAAGRPICMRGAYLDLKIEFNGGKLQSFGPPKLLSPFEAASVFALRDVAARALLPINLSKLSERVVSAALIGSTHPNRTTRHRTGLRHDNRRSCFSPRFPMSRHAAILEAAGRLAGSIPSTKKYNSDNAWEVNDAVGTEMGVDNALKLKAGCSFVGQSAGTCPSISNASDWLLARALRTEARNSSGRLRYASIRSWVRQRASLKA